MHSKPIVFIFNSPLSSGCDYVVQTMRVMAGSRPVYGVALGDIISLPRLLVSKNRWVVRRAHGATIIRPVSFFPGVRLRGIRAVAYLMASLILWLYIAGKHFGIRKILWFFEPFHVPGVAPVFFGYETVYDCVDYYPGFSPHAKHQHEQLMHTSTHVFANSAALTKELQKTRSDVVNVPLGFADSLFRNTSKSSVRSHKHDYTVGFVGSISDRMDFALLHKAIVQLPDIRFVFAGPLERDVFHNGGSAAAEWSSLLQLENVMWLGAVPKDKIPSIILDFDACLIPYRIDNTFNRFSFPMKTLEYFALGKPVIATPVESLKPFGSSGLVFIVNSPLTMISAIRDIQKRGWGRQKQEKQMRIAMNNTWKKKVAAILAMTQA